MCSSKRVAVEIPIKVTTIMMKIMMKDNSIKETAKRTHKTVQKYVMGCNWSYYDIESPELYNWNVHLKPNRKE